MTEKVGMQSYALNRAPAKMAGFPLTVDKHQLMRSLTRAMRPFQGQLLSVGLLEAKGPHWTVVTGTLVGCYAGGFLLAGSPYRFFINWVDVWTGHAVVHGEPGAAITRARARLCAAGTGRQ